MKRIIILSFITMLISGCLATPKNRADFVKLSESHGSDSNKISIVINKPLSYVNKRLARLSKKCLNARVVMTSERTLDSSRAEIDYFSTFRKVNRNKSELTIRTSPRGMFSSKERIFVFTADATAINKKKTKLRIYKAYGYSHFVGIVKKSASGKMKGCPSNIHQ